MKKLIIAVSLLTSAFAIGSIASCTKSSNKANTQLTTPPIMAASTTDTAIAPDTSAQLSWYNHGTTDSTRSLQVTLTYLPNNGFTRYFDDSLYLHTSNGINWAIPEGQHNNQYSADSLPNNVTFQLYLVRISPTTASRDTLITMHN